MESMAGRKGAWEQRILLYAFQRENASPAPGTTAEEAMSRGPPPAPEGGSRDEQDGASADAEPWAAAVPPVSGRR